jgi:hypothetical protein
MRLLLLSVLLVFMAGWCSAEIKAEDGAPNIVKAHSTVNYKWYPPDSTPPPEVLPGMKGNTRYNFPFGANYNFSESHSKVDKGCAVTLVVTSLEIKLGLALDIALPKGCSDHLRSHEEGHRRIYEHFYDAYAESAARKAADEVFGKPVQGEGRNCKDAKDAAIVLLNDKLSEAYRRLESDPAKNANDFYDKLTNHGRFEKVDSVTAAEEAIKSFTENKGIEKASSETPAAAAHESSEPVEHFRSSPGG